jgi:hypothetical protein
VNQHDVVGFQATAFEQIGPDSEKSFRQGGSLHQVHIQRHRQTLAGRCDAVLGITAAGQQGANRIAEAQSSHVVAAHNDMPGNFQAGQVRGAHGGRVQATTLQAVRAIDAGCGNTNQNLVGSRHRHWSCGRRKDIGRSMPTDFHNPHALGERRLGHLLVLVPNASIPV